MDNYEKKATLNSEKGFLPVHNLQLEEGVLGAVLLEKLAFGETQKIGLTSKDFYKDAHALVFEACQQLYEKERPIDLITVKGQLDKNNNLEDVGGAFGIVRLTTEVSSSANVAYHSTELKQMTLLRKIEAFCSTTKQKSLQVGADSLELLQKMKEFVSDTSFLPSSSKITTGAAAAKRLLDKARENKLNLLKNGLAGITGGSSFSKVLDFYTFGKKTKKTYCYAGYTSHGKSLALTCELGKAARSGTKVGCISLEMDDEELVNRIISEATDVPYFCIVNGIMNDEEERRVSDHILQFDEMYRNNIFFSIPEASDIRSIELIIFDFKKLGVDQIYLDYIQIADHDEKGLATTYAIGKYSKQLKQLSRKYDIAFTYLAQLSRKALDVTCVEDLNSGMIADSVKIEQDTDVIVLFMVYSKFGIKHIQIEDEYGMSQEIDTHCEDTKRQLVGFKLVKQRGGATGVWDMWGKLSTGNYEDLQEYIKLAEGEINRRISRITNESTEEEVVINKDNSDTPF